VVVPPPAIAIVKSERLGSTGSYRPGPINVLVGQTIDYHMVVTNTGGVALTVTLLDPRCDPGTLQAVGSTTLAPGAVVAYICSHRLLATDRIPFVNTATATAVTPAGVSVGPVSSKVVAQPTGGVLGASFTKTTPKVKKVAVKPKVKK
jgi:uncharacterized repeat protein (TIGR01451 family)